MGLWSSIQYDIIIFDIDADIICCDGELAPTSDLEIAMRNLFKKRWFQVAAISLFVLALTCVPKAMGGNNAPQAAPPAPMPAAAPSFAPELHAQRSPSATPVPAAPTLSEADKEALAYADFHWDVFVLALRASNSVTKLSEAQLNKPPMTVAKDLSGCPPGSQNRTAKAIKAAVGYCDGEVRVVTAAFNSLNDNEQRIAVANAFLYHALAKTTAQQRKLPSGASRNDARVLGCLQASLSYAFERYSGQLAEDVWVVMSDSVTSGDVFNSYRSTYDFNGAWQ